MESVYRDTVSLGEIAALKSRVETLEQENAKLRRQVGTDLHPPSKFTACPACHIESIKIDSCNQRSPISRHFRRGGRFASLLFGTPRGPHMLVRCELCNARWLEMMPALPASKP